VCKHACHLVGTMAIQMGHKFEMHALYYLPEVFKILVISIQVRPTTSLLRFLLAKAACNPGGYSGDLLAA